MKKIMILSDAANVHTQKWARYFRDQKYDVHLVSLLPASIDGVKIHLLKSKAYAKRTNNMKYNKLAVLLEVLPQLKKLLKEIEPVVLHAHFASSFGLFAALTNFHPFYLSVWGYDTITFPKLSLLHKAIVKFTLHKADKIFATSDFLAQETAQYTDKPQIITPFGVDIEQFKPMPKKDKEKFIFGTVKALEKKYGIDYLLKAAAIINTQIVNWELWIAGSGTEREHLEKLAVELKIEQKVKFLGRVDHAAVPRLINEMDVFTVTSVWKCESFGVAAVEAEACGIPVIASDLGGLTEVIIDGITGFHVKPRDPEDIAEKILILYKDKNLRQEMGRMGRKNVLKKYVWKNNAQTMLENYHL